MAPYKFLTLGNNEIFSSKLNKSLIMILTVPYVSNNPVKVYANIYEGMASGSIRAHSRKSFPGN